MLAFHCIAGSHLTRTLITRQLGIPVARSAEGTQRQRCWAVRLRAGLGKPQLRQRSDRIFATDVRNDAQLEHSDRREFDVMVFRLASCALGLKFHCCRTISRNDCPPSGDQRKTYSCVRSVRVSKKVQPDPADPLRMGKEDPDRLLSGPCGTPPRALPGQQRGLNWMIGILRGDFHLPEPLHVQPVLVRRCGFLLNLER